MTWPDAGWAVVVWVGVLLGCLSYAALRAPLVVWLKRTRERRRRRRGRRRRRRRESEDEVLLSEEEED